MSVLSKREGSKLRFSLRPGVGDWVDRAPWKIEWGGGASVENPHFQRVHYCDLLVRLLIFAFGIDINGGSLQVTC